MPREAFMVLEDGSCYEGILYGAEIGTQGEAVYFANFNNCEDVLTDPASAGKIFVIDTMPAEDESEAQSDNLWASGLVLGEIDSQLSDYLEENGTPALVIGEIKDLCQKLQSKAQTAVIGFSAQAASDTLKTATKYDHLDLTKQVTTSEEYCLMPDEAAVANVVLIDLGVRQDLIDKLLAANVKLEIVSATITAEEVLAKHPQGLVISSGPGNPEKLRYVYDLLCQLVGSCPIFAVGLGCQMIAQTFSVKTCKVTSRHNGSAVVRFADRYESHTVSQNSSYAIDPERIRYGLNVAARMVADNSVAALGHDMLPITGLDYYGEENSSACSFDALLKGFVGSMQRKQKESDIDAKTP